MSILMGNRPGRTFTRRQPGEKWSRFSRAVVPGESDMPRVFSLLIDIGQHPPFSVYPEAV